MRQRASVGTFMIKGAGPLGYNEFKKCTDVEDRCEI